MAKTAKTVNARVVARARAYGVEVITRRGWTFNPLTLRVYAWRRKYRPHALIPGHSADTLWQHISVTHREGIRRDMRTLHRIGMERFGSGVSYNFAIDMVTGQVGVGQPLDAKGTHTINYKNVRSYSYDQNAVSIAFCFVGMPGMIPTAPAIHAAAMLFAACIAERVLTQDPDYNPHSMVAAKDCPTDAIRNVMPEIRRMALNKAAGEAIR